jgi:hypothetical protein
VCACEEYAQIAWQFPPRYFSVACQRVILRDFTCALCASWAQDEPKVGVALLEMKRQDYPSRACVRTYGIYIMTHITSDG